jgi:hypothetical protein
MSHSGDDWEKLYTKTNTQVVINYISAAALARRIVDKP